MNSLLLAAISLSPTDVGLPTSTGSITDIILNVIKLLLALIGALSVIFIIIGGIQMVSAAGNPKNFARGRETLLYAVVGIIVALGAYGIVSFIGGAF
jgi:cellulose synthase/poly-beta-1,6-N-acetylglucosamine synthase-like glycosyltransferase